MGIKRWFVLGTGPFALEVFDWARDYLGPGSEQVFGGFLGDAQGAAPQALGLPSFDERAFDFQLADRVFNAISDPEIKQKVGSALGARKVRFETLIHPSAVVRAVEIGEGSIICPGAVIGSRTRLGRFVTLNYQCGIGHESDIGDWCTIAPGVQIGGRTRLGTGCVVGLSATIIDNVKIGEHVTINAGAVVISRIRDGKKVSGNPARKTELF